MLPHQERVLKEKEELNEKLLKLKVFINKSNDFLSLDASERNRLLNQMNVMGEYSRILGERIAAFTK